MPAGIVGGFVASRFADDNCPDIQFHIAHASFANPAKRVFDPFQLSQLALANFVRTVADIAIFRAQTQNCHLK